MIRAAVCCVVYPSGTQSEQTRASTCMLKFFMFLLVFVGLIVSTVTSERPKKTVSQMTCCMSSIVNPTLASSLSGDRR